MPLLNLNNNKPQNTQTNLDPQASASTTAAQNDGYIEPELTAALQNTASETLEQNQTIDPALTLNKDLTIQPASELEDGINEISKPLVETQVIENKPIDPSLNLNSKISSLQESFKTTLDQEQPQSIESLAQAARAEKLKDTIPGASIEELASIQQKGGTIASIQEYLRQAIALEASDLHITVGYRVMVRVNGVLKSLQSPVVTADDCVMYVKELLKYRSDLNFDKVKEVDLTYSFSNRRFRVNIFKQMNTFSIVCRVIPEKILTIEELGLPTIVKDFSKFANGLVLVTGPTGSGKSTTIASILNLINLTQPKHIITLEDPIEFVFPKGIGLIDQREYGIDFTSWPRALRSILRQDPDIVLIGEMRDLETIEAALQIAETGHLVFATLHTNSAASTVDRIVDIFPAAKQDQIKVQFSSVIRAILSQKLVKTLDDRRRVAVEILLANSAVRNAIRENKGYQIDNVIQTSSDVGMISLEKSLVNLVKEGVITTETAKLNSVKPAEIDILLSKK